MTRHFMRLLERVDRSLLACEVVLICVTLSLMLGLSALQVILRNVFDTGIHWADIFVRHLVLLLLFLGASLSTRGRRHIQMDVSSQVIPARFKPALGLGINAFCVLLNYYLFQASWKFMADERASGSVLFDGLPVWVFISCMPAGFFVIAARFAMNWINDVLALAGLKKPQVEEHALAAPIH